METSRRLSISPGVGRVEPGTGASPQAHAAQVDGDRDQDVVRTEVRAKFTPDGITDEFYRAGRPSTSMRVRSS